MSGRGAPWLSTVRAAAAVSFLLTGAAGAVGQPPGPSGAPTALSNLPVPGGTAALAKLAGVDEAAPRGVALLQVIRVMHESPTGSEPSRDQRLERLHAYLRDLSGFLRACGALGDKQMSAGLARSRQPRRAMENIARAVGGELQEERGAYRLVLRDDDESRRRREHVGTAGLNVASLEEDFNAGRTVDLTVASDDVPLPFDARTWERLVAGAPEELSGSLATALLGDRRASLLYYGLMGLDAESRGYVASRPELPGKLADGDRPFILASLGRSIRVHGGVIDVPGGSQAVPLWEGLLSKRVNEPESFILELLDRDGGRAALLYDLVDHLDPPQQTFVLSLRAPDRGARLDRLRALLDASAPSLVRWDPEIRPFRRVVYDPIHLLATTRVLPTGELPQPAGRRFWTAALASAEIPSDTARLLQNDGPDIAADAAWLVEQLCVADPQRRQQRLRTWQFAQRVLAGTAPAALPDALVAVRAFARFPLLLLTLERIGLTDPQAYAAAARRAQQVSEIGDRDATITALSQFQGALSILERLRSRRAVAPDVALRLARELADVPLDESGEYLGGVGRWLQTRLLPALPPLSERDAKRARTTVSEETTLLAAIAGVSAQAVSPVVEWEGLRYRVDVGAAEFGRLVRVRQKQGGHDLNASLGLLDAVTQLGSGKADPAGVPARAATLLSRVDALLAHVQLSGDAARTSDLPDLLKDAADDLRKVRTPRDSANLTRVYRPLQRACDLLFASVLSSIAYAPVLGDPDGPELLAGDPAERHSFGFEERISELRILMPWRLPQRAVGTSGGWRMTGSLLGLDIGLAPLTLQRIMTEGLPPPPSGNELDRASVATGVALSNPFAVSNAERDALADAIRRGRARLDGLAAHPSALPALIRAAQVNEWWRTALPWAQQHEPDRVAEYFSLADLVRIGEAETTPSPPLDGWGSACLDTCGCLCLRVPSPGVREILAGRMGAAMVTEQFDELPLKVAEVLAEFGLPAQLARSMIALAAQDVLDAYRPAYIDDWTALEAAVRRLSASRFVDYVAALTAGGPLVPDEPERSDDARR